MSLRIICLIILLISTSSCDLTRNNVFAPNKRLFKMLPKDANPDYAAGWNDGCETGLATGFANDYYKSFYKFRKDREQVKKGNKMYTRPWSAAMIYCRHFAVGTLKEAEMSPKLPGIHRPMVLGEHSLFGNVFHPSNQGAVGLKHW